MTNLKSIIYVAVQLCRLYVVNALSAKCILKICHITMIQFVLDRMELEMRQNKDGVTWMLSMT